LGDSRVASPILYKGEHSLAYAAWEGAKAKATLLFSHALAARPVVRRAGPGSKGETRPPSPPL
jgi:hypothetical protein